MTPRITLRTNAKLVSKEMERLRQKTPLIARERIKKAADDIARRLSKPGKKITYPVKWDSDKQRIAYFATDGFSHPKGWKRPAGYINTHIPYKRTGKRASGWRVTETSTGYRVDNRYRIGKYIYGLASGEKQSRIHKDRWPLFKKVVDAVVKYLPKSVIKALRIYSRKA